MIHVIEFKPIYVVACIKFIKINALSFQKNSFMQIVIETAIPCFLNKGLTTNLEFKYNQVTLKKTKHLKQYNIKVIKALLGLTLFLLFIFPVSRTCQNASLLLVEYNYRDYFMQSNRRSFQTICNLFLSIILYSIQYSCGFT